MQEIQAHITGTVWKLQVAPGATIDVGDEVVILESMKMEMPVESEVAGTVTDITCTEGMAVSEGDVLLLVDSEA